MKKYLILAFLAMATVSCKFEDIYVQENVQDLVTYSNGRLTNDIGTVFEVSASDISQNDWKVEGQRQLMRFDILNRNLEIHIHETHPMTKVTPDPYEELEELPIDPVVIQMGFLSGGYMNLMFTGYQAKGSNHAPQYYFRESNQNNVVQVYLYYDGNNENPATMSSDLLESTNYYVSIPLPESSGTSYNVVRLQAYRLRQDSAGKVFSELYVYDFNGSY